MRKVGICVPLVLLIVVVLGCSKKASEEDNAPPPNAPINNNAPQAKGAPAAPGPGADVPSPGGRGLKKTAPPSK